jgi:hydroxymethylbilane synthase
MKQIKLGTRGSQLALVQARWVKDGLEALHTSVKVEIVTITTKGDMQTGPLSTGGDTGLFTKVIEDALLRDEVDIAVHSLKDLPTVQPAGLAIAAVPKRLDPHDALVSRDGMTLDALGKGARIGTSSVRRKAQLLAFNCEIEVVPLRGNLDTRLRRVLDADFDAIVVAKAGLIRMQRDDVKAVSLPFDKVLPAAGQGALAVEARQDDAELLELVGGLNHADSAATTRAERMVLERLGAGCQVPIGVLAESAGSGNMRLRCAVFSIDGRDVVQADSTGTSTEAVMDKVVNELVEQGARALINNARGDE